MIQKINIKNYLNKQYISFGLFVILDIFFIIFILYFAYKIFGIYQEIQALEQEIEQLKSTSILIKNNKDLLKDDITEYNKTLDNLIPSGETYFQVISAFEQLESRSGVNIGSYTINLDETTEEKMSLNLVITGAQNAIESLLENYHYFGGRLMTNEELTYSSNDAESINFTVNVFHTASKPMSIDIDGNKNIISDDDIDLIKSIQKKL